MQILIKKKKKKKKTSLEYWRCGTSGRAPALQAQSIEFKLQAHQKTMTSLALSQKSISMSSEANETPSLVLKNFHPSLELTDFTGKTKHQQLSMAFFFFFFAVPEFELRVWHLLGRHSNHLNHSSQPLSFHSIKQCLPDYQ
jgi:hypothetical protein